MRTITNIKSMFSLEGIDGSGKSTQLVSVAEELRILGVKVAALKSPSERPAGDFLRKHVKELDPEKRNNLFIEDMEESLRLVEGDSVILWDRYVDSFYASNREMTIVSADGLTKDLPKPKLTFFLDIDVNSVLSERATSLHHHSDPDWLKLKVERYRELASREPNRFVIIDARQSASVITEQIVKSII